VGGAASIAVTTQSAATAPVNFGAANAPGGLVSIYGQQMADRTGQPSGAPFPTQLNGTQVLMGGTPLPLR